MQEEKGKCSQEERVRKVSQIDDYGQEENSYEYLLENYMGLLVLIFGGIFFVGLFFGIFFNIKNNLNIATNTKSIEYCPPLLQDRTLPKILWMFSFVGWEA